MSITKNKVLACIECTNFSRVSFYVKDVLDVMSKDELICKSRYPKDKLESKFIGRTGNENEDFPNFREFTLFAFERGGRTILRMENKKDLEFILYAVVD